MNDKRNARLLETLVNQENALKAQPQTMDVLRERKRILLRTKSTLCKIRRNVGESAGQGLKLAKSNTDHRPHDEAA